MAVSQSPQYMKVNCMQACILLTMENTFKVIRGTRMKQKKKWKKFKQVFFTTITNEKQDVIDDRKIMAVVIAAVTLTCMWTLWKSTQKMVQPALLVSTILLAFTFIVCGTISVVKPNRQRLTGVISSVAIVVVFTLYTFYGFNQGFALLWSLMVPYASMTVIGLLDGAIVTMYLCILFFVYFWTPLHAMFSTSYSEVYCSRFPMLFFLCSVVSLYTNYKLKQAKLHQYREKERLKVAIEEERRKIGKITMQTIISISNAVDAKDSYTKKHSERVAKYSKIIANELRWSKKEQENLYNMALLHDIGKIGVPDAILNKHGQLTDEEFPQIRKHPVIGGQILKDFTIAEDLSVGAFYHHERFDGKGYPQGLKGEEIPIEARIIGIADSIDAMNSDRVYRGKKDISYILEQLEAGKGTQFDPNIDEIVIALIKKGKLRLDIF